MGSRARLSESTEDVCAPAAQRLVQIKSAARAVSFPGACRQRVAPTPPEPSARGAQLPIDLGGHLRQHAAVGV